MTPDPTVIDLTVDDRAPDDTQHVDPHFDPHFAGTPGGDIAETQTNDNGSLPMLITFIGAIVAIGFLKSWWIPGILAGLLFMLFMHELGHYLTARASGMKVTEFFLGFGPKIWSFNKGETEYGVKAIPAGAYVRIIGMTNLDDIEPAEEHRTYRAQPYWQRMMTICAGSAMHFLMATVALFVLFVGYGYAGFNGPPWYVDVVVEGSTASALGIEPGDEILSVNDESFANWDEFGDVVSNLEEGPVDIVIERDNERLNLAGELGLRPEDVLLDGFGLSLIVEDVDVGLEVGYLWPNDLADQFGLVQGDVLVSAGGVGNVDQTSLAALLRQNNGDDFTIEVQRNGELVSLTDTVELRTDAPFRGFFGVGPVFVPDSDPGVGTSAGLAVEDFAAISKANLVSLGDMVNPSRWFGDQEPGVQRRAQLQRADNATPVQPTESGDTNRPLSVVGIGRLIADSESVQQVLFLFAIVNIFIGIFNLVPLLPLDGGHALIATYERARSLATRRPHRVDATKLIPLTWVVILLLVGVGVWTVTLDIFSWPGS